MTYHVDHLPKFNNTAGKITILTAFAGLFVFMFAFLVNVGTNEFQRVEAQGSATTTLTVLNTPPQWTVFAYETIESSTSSPTNSGNQISWTAVGTDSNSQPYFLIVCSTNATPTAFAASSTNDLGTRPPSCTPTSTLWAVSPAASSGLPAIAATTTTEDPPYAESNDWYAWICDDDPINPRCNNTFSQGTNATNSSPFVVNRRPIFEDFYTLSSADPGGTITFYSTSSDPDSFGGQDAIFLIVCYENDFSTTTGQCGPGGTIASTTGIVNDNATAVFTLPAVIQDDIYDAFGFLIDEHIHSAIGPIQGSNPGFTVNNVAPTVPDGSISINNGSSTLSLTNPGGQTTGYTLDFVISDANSCLNVDVPTSSEITGYVVSIFKTSIGSSTCDGSAGAYDPNNCYVSGVPTSTWNLSCTASTTSCTGNTDPTLLFNCTFPLWFLADPTDDVSPSSTDTWSVAIAGVDDDNATGTLTVGTFTFDIITFPALDLLTAEIPYGALEPGSNTGTLNASTTIVAIGNAGLDQALEGESMCTTFSIGNECPVSSTSTVPEDQQRFGTSSVSYASGFPLSSTTPFELETNIRKSTSTTLFSQGQTYWGIAVPSSISLAGAYTGLNTFYAVIAEAIDW